MGGFRSRMVRMGWTNCANRQSSCEEKWIIISGRVVIRQHELCYELIKKDRKRKPSIARQTGIWDRKVSVLFSTGSIRSYRNWYSCRSPPWPEGKNWVLAGRWFRPSSENCRIASNFKSPGKYWTHPFPVKKIAPPALFSHWRGFLVWCLVLGPVKSSRGFWF
jgi:hypothetical protein